MNQQVAALSIVLVFVLSVLPGTGSADENDTIDVCNLDSKQGMEKMKTKYRSNIENWKELHQRACKANVSIEDANKGLNDCLEERFSKMEDGSFKQLYQETFDKCMKKIAPIKQMCDTTEQKERIYCIMVEVRKKFTEMCPKYIEHQQQQRQMFRDAFKCLDDKLKEKNV